MIALPTDTVYGQVCLAQNQKAVERLFQIKQRTNDKSIAICVGVVQALSSHCKLGVNIRPLLAALLPGPVTLLFEALPYMHSYLVSKTNLVGVRIPDNPFIMHVARLCNGAIALTTANKSSATNCLSVKEFQQLWPFLDAIFDGGTLGAIDPMRLGSTIVDLSVEGTFRIIRNECALDCERNIICRSQDFF